MAVVKVWTKVYSRIWHSVMIGTIVIIYMRNIMVLFIQAAEKLCCSLVYRWQK